MDVETVGVDGSKLTWFPSCNVGIGSDSAVGLSERSMILAMRRIEQSQSAGDLSVSLKSSLMIEKSESSHELLCSQAHHLKICSNHSPLPLHVHPTEVVVNKAGFPFGNVNAGLGSVDPMGVLSRNNSGELPFWLKDSPLISSATSIVGALSTVGGGKIANSRALCYDEKLKDPALPLILYKNPHIEWETASMVHVSKSKIGYRSPYVEGGTSSMFQISKSKGPSSTRRMSEGNCSTSRKRCLPTVVASEEDARARRRMLEKARRDRIARGIKELKSCVPCSDETTGDFVSVIDDASEYIKFLKHQIQVLSQSCLNGRTAPYPFVYQEGYGHYLLHPQTSITSLEETIEQLLKSNSKAADELMEAKELAILPMDYAYGLLLAS